MNSLQKFLLSRAVDNLRDNHGLLGEIYDKFGLEYHQAMRALGRPAEMTLGEMITTLEALLPEGMPSGTSLQRVSLSRSLCVEYGIANPENKDGVICWGACAGGLSMPKRMAWGNTPREALKKLLPEPLNYFGDDRDRND